MDKKIVDEILDKNLDELCEKNGYDKEYVKKSCENAMSGFLDESGNISDEKVSEQIKNLTGMNLAGMDLSSFLTPDMIKQTMQFFTSFGGMSPTGEKDKEEPTDMIIEED